jgi:hypothetical protein
LVTCDGFDLVDWSKEQPEVASKVIELYDHQPADVQIQITLDLERIKHMTDEVGQAALLTSPPDQNRHWQKSMTSAPEMKHG